jgi:hypothetical protein
MNQGNVSRQTDSGIQENHLLRRGSFAIKLSSDGHRTHPNLHCGATRRASIPEALFAGVIERDSGARLLGFHRLLAVRRCANLDFCAVYAESWSVSAHESGSGKASGW